MASRQCVQRVDGDQSTTYHRERQQRRLYRSSNRRIGRKQIQALMWCGTPHRSAKNVLRSKDCFAATIYQSTQSFAQSDVPVRWRRGMESAHVRKRSHSDALLVYFPRWRDVESSRLAGRNDCACLTSNRFEPRPSGVAGWVPSA